jgi:NDP-sugar pyrophosphorylase family protein
MSNIDVLILCGGQGTRLQKVVSDRPKSMAEINGRAFLDILLNYLRGFGINRFILCVGYKADFIEAYYNEKRHLFEILFSHETNPLGTGGALKHAEKLIQSDPFLVLNGDSFCPVELESFFNFHISRKALVSIVVTETEHSQDFGIIKLDNSYKIIQFNEKFEGKGKAFVNAGIYLFEKDIFPLIPTASIYSLEYDLFPKLVGNRFYGYITNERLIDIGTPERYAHAKRVFSS